MEHQQSLTPAAPNEAWGDARTYDQPHEHFHVLFRNISTLNPQTMDMVAIVTEIETKNTSIFLAQETNIA